jgi:ubiquinone/menaquinone biosynthesis C-methylase UbiE
MLPLVEAAAMLLIFVTSVFLHLGFDRAETTDRELFERFQDEVLHALELREALPEARDRLQVSFSAGPDGRAAAEAPNELRQGAEAWGLLLPAALRFSPPSIPEQTVGAALAAVRSVRFRASFAAEVRFEMLTETGTAEDALRLAEELAEFLRPLQGSSNSAVEVRESLSRAAISREGSLLRLVIPLTPRALERIRRNDAARRILTWRLPDEERERRQNLPAIWKALAVGPGDRVADVGAGEGFMSLRLARTVAGGGGRVFAVDISESALETLRGKLDRLAVSNVEVVAGAPDDPKLPAGTLDAALIVNSYHEMAEHEKMLEGIRRALKPGGRLVVVEPFKPDSRGEPREAQVKEHLIAPELIEEELRRAGFEVAERLESLTEPGESGRRDSLVLARRP